VISSAAPVAGAGLSGALGTIQRPDGTEQVTYKGKPLYYFSQDMTSGTGGNGIVAFGGSWSVAEP
jgi:predicted lipoprotein with Yx(FWY)xxD motif